MQTFLQVRCEILSLKVQHLWFNQSEGIIDDLITGSKDFEEGSVVYVLENINLFLSQCIDKIGHAKSQIREFDGWCNVNIFLSVNVSQTFHVKLDVTTNCFPLVFYVH